MGKFKTLKPKYTALDTRIGVSPSTPRIRGRRLQGDRGRIFLRDDYICQSCRRFIPDDDGLRLDHKTPLELGGSNSDGNLQTLCIECHDAKNEREGRERMGW